MGIQKRRDYYLVGDRENLRNFMEGMAFELNLKGWLGFKQRSKGYLRMKEHNMYGCRYDWMYWRMVRNSFLAGWIVGYLRSRSRSRRQD